MNFILLKKVIKLTLIVIFWPFAIVYFLIKSSSRNKNNNLNSENQKPILAKEARNTTLNLPVSMASQIRFTVDQCPNCHVKLGKILTRKTKCKSCGKDFYVRTHFSTKEKILLSESQKNKYELQATEFYFEKEWIRKLSYIGITESDIEENRKELREKWGPGHPSFRDLMWRTFNKQVLKLSKERATYYEFKMLYFNWALFAFEIDVDPTNLQKQCHKFELMEFKNHRIKKVTVLCNHGCDGCQKNNNKEFDIDKLLPEQDILPCKDCTEKLGQPERKFSWCRCIFQSKSIFD